MLVFKSTLHVRLLIELETNHIIETVQAPFVDLIHSWRKAMKWSFSVLNWFSKHSVARSKTDQTFSLIENNYRNILI